jgi:ketosteroid isomerase-like protein
MDADRVESLKQAERRLQAAQLASDVTVLGELLDEDAMFTGPDGNLYTRDDDLRVHGTGHQVMTRVDEEELRISTFGDDVGVTFFLGTLEGTVGGDSIKARMRYTRTWKHDNTRWRIIAAHASFLTDEAQSG